MFKYEDLQYCRSLPLLFQSREDKKNLTPLIGTCSSEEPSKRGAWLPMGWWTDCRWVLASYLQCENIDFSSTVSISKHFQTVRKKCSGVNLLCLLFIRDGRILCLLSSSIISRLQRCQCSGVNLLQKKWHTIVKLGGNQPAVSVCFFASGISNDSVNTKQSNKLDKTETHLPDFSMRRHRFWFVHCLYNLHFVCIWKLIQHDPRVLTCMLVWWHLTENRIKENIY